VLAVILIADYLYDGVIVWLAPLAVGVAIAGVWFARPLARGGKSSGP
jgi:hypothetical protein